MQYTVYAHSWLSILDVPVNVDNCDVKSLHNHLSLSCKASRCCGFVPAPVWSHIQSITKELTQ